MIERLREKRSGRRRRLRQIAGRVGLLIFFVLECSSTHEEITWKPFATFSSDEIVESSGLVKSRQFDGVFWTHNDRGDRARIFAVSANGNLIQEIEIRGAQNVDWEDIATDNSGRLYIGDFGDNRKKHQQRVIYVVKEPNPFESDFAPVLRRILFDFPARKNRQPKKNAVDCEALFWANGQLYCLTKHSQEKITRLYRFDLSEDVHHQTLTEIAEFKIDGAVTSADASIDGNKLLVLCYESIFLFEKPASSDNYLVGPFKRIPIPEKKSEGICFDGADIFFSNEQGEIYKISQSIFETRLAVRSVETKIANFFQL
jgi:hypothetical protein